MRPTEEITLRIYGQNLTLTRSQWELLLEDMRPDCDNAGRIFERLATFRVTGIGGRDERH